jgi:hypothetical protein
VLFAKYGLHLPLTRQNATYAREGIELDVSTLADWVGASAATLMPLVEAIRAHVFAAQRLHADDTTVPVLDTGRTRTGRLWTYVRDDRPFAGADPPAAIYFYSPDRRGEHPEAHLASWAGLMQADAYAGYDRLYAAGRKAGPIVEAGCWAHARRKFFDLARLNKAPIAIEAVARIDAVFAIERDINGLSPDERLQVRHERSRPRVEALGTWLREQHARLSPNNQVAKAIAYSLNAWDALVRFLDDGRLCMTNYTAERALRWHRRRPQQLDLCRFRRRRPARGSHLHADRDCKAQRRRSSSLARRRARTSAGSSDQAHRRAAALELETAATAAASGRLNPRSDPPHAINCRFRGLPGRVRFHSPNTPGRSRHGAPVRTIHSTPSKNMRLSRPVEPFWSGIPMIRGAIRSHCHRSIPVGSSRPKLPPKDSFESQINPTGNP